MLWTVIIYHYQVDWQLLSREIGTIVNITFSNNAALKSLGKKQHFFDKISMFFKLSVLLYNLPKKQIESFVKLSFCRWCHWYLGKKYSIWYLFLIESIIDVCDTGCLPKYAHPVQSLPPLEILWKQIDRSEVLLLCVR